MSNKIDINIKMETSKELEETLNFIQNNHEESFVNNYDHWCEVVELINKDIEKYIISINLDCSLFKEQLYSYNEFCSLYVENIKTIANKKHNLEQSDINLVIKSLILNKIDIIKQYNMTDYNINFIKEFTKNNVIGRYV